MVDWVAIIVSIIIVTAIIVISITITISTTTNILIRNQLAILIQPHKQHLKAVIDLYREPIIMQLQYNLKIHMLDTLLCQVNTIFYQLFYKLEELLLLELISRM